MSKKISRQNNCAFSIDVVLINFHKSMRQINDKIRVKINVLLSPSESAQGVIHVVYG